MEIPENYHIIRRNVKNIRLKVNEEEQVFFYVPDNLTDADLETIIEKRRFWIEKKLAYFRQMSRIELSENQILLYGNRYQYYYKEDCGNRVILNHKTHTIQSIRDLTDPIVQARWLKRLARKQVLKRIEYLSASLALPYNKVYVRSSKTKWGNCSKDKNISINWKLIKAPSPVLDYIIVHELVHTLVMNHSVKFKALLYSYFPDYMYAQNWLDKYGNSL